MYLFILLTIFLILYLYKNNYIEPFIDFNKIFSNYIDKSNDITINKTNKLNNNIQENILPNIDKPNIDIQNIDKPNNNLVYNTDFNIQDKINTQNIKKEIELLKENNINEKLTNKQENNIFNECQFYNKCPDGYSSNGYFSILGSDIICGGNENFKKASLIAVIKNKKIYQIHIIEKGSGYDNLSKINVIGGNGQGAKLEPIIDDNGSIVAINILNPGDLYTETPKVEILNNNNKCELCCKKNI